MAEYGKHTIDDPEIRSKLNEIGNMIGAKLPRTFGFTLLIFSFGPKGSMFYISNAERENVIKLMEEFIAKHKPNQRKS